MQHGQAEQPADRSAPGGAQEPAVFGRVCERAPRDEAREPVPRRPLGGVSRTHSRDGGLMVLGSSCVGREKTKNDNNVFF